MPIQRLELKLEAMRRFKQREFLRIGTRDILGLADMPTTAREFSNLADACVQACLEAATLEIQNKKGPPPPFIVVAMGKHGGRELNYSSDIDLLFVCADNDATTQRPNDPTTLAELVIQFLTKNMQNGHLFRVDMKLRPEGRFGPLVRTLSSYRAYYESWAESWERQALIKARVVAGDSELGEAFQEMVTPFVYRGMVTSDFVDSVRRNKERIEERAGVGMTNIKLSAGGIRDIEFTAQLLQLQLGGRYPHVRTPNTLDALGRLRQIGFLSAQEAAEMADDYRFLRTVEHRLQILYELQTQSLPTKPAERRLLGRRLGFPDAEAFNSEFERRTRRVRAHCERLFYGSGRDPESADQWSGLLANSTTEAGQRAVELALEAEGFPEPDRAAATLRGLLFGSSYGESPPDAREMFLRLSGRLIAACTRTGDPNAALQGIEALALANPNPAAFYRLLIEGEELLDRLCLLSAGSLPLSQHLARRLEWLDMLVSEEAVDSRLKPVEAYRSDLDERLAGAVREEQFWDRLALYIQRERLRVAARDLWGELGSVGVMRELTALAEAVLSALLDRAISSAERTRPDQAGVLKTIALIGLGKLGGREVGYASDWDIVAVYRKPSENLAEAFAAVEGVISYILSAGQNLTVRGAPVEIDARLRPEGKKGALAYAPEEYERYYLSAALPWEKQVLTKARPVAGNDGSAADFMEARNRTIYTSPFPAEGVEKIRAMKRRMEKERLRPDERQTDIKLGWGGMSDIEFLVQLLQLKSGAAHPEIRGSETVGALYALGAAGVLPSPDAARLADSYRYYNAVRNRLALMGAPSPNVLPKDDRRMRSLAIGLGVSDTDTEAAETIFRRQFEERMRDTRSLFERLFFEGAVGG
jgi:glutamate-ammonia-ligase adenylyltransferase